MSAVAGRAPVHVGGLSDEELVKLARAGDEDAFEAIVHRYRSPLQAYCRRWLDAHRAEEVVQHTLMKAYLCVRDDDRPLVLRPWLYRVAHNAALNAVEKKGSDWEELDENYDGVPQPPQVAEQRARFLSVVGEIGALPARQREALVLNEFEGRCYADIAAELGTSESGVRGLLRRARRQLRETAAAVLLPFPVLRELVRSDGGRGLQIDRASELVATAGAAGGVGATGGLAKVAAGVLAAGTIAGGGTAIEYGSGAFRPQEGDASVQQADGDGAARSALATTATAGGPLTISRLAADGAQLFAGADLARDGAGADDGLGGIESDSPAGTDPGEVEPAPLIPEDPLGTAEPEAEEEPAGDEEPADDEVSDDPNAGEDPNAGDPNESESTDPTGDDEPAADGDPESDPDATPSAPVLPHFL